MAVSFAQSNVGVRDCADSGAITQGSVTTAAGDVLVIFDVAGRTAPWQTQWSIDGGAALTPLSSYDEAGEAAVVHMYAVTGLAAGSHTIDATNPASGGSTGRFVVYGWAVAAGADAAAIDSGDVRADITGSTSAAKTWATGPVAANGGAIGFMASRAGAAVASVDHTNLGTVSTGGGTVSYSSAALQSYTTAAADTDETMGVTFGGTGSGAYVGIVLAPAAVGTPATFTTLAGDATAAGGDTSMQGAARFAAAAGSATGGGGSTTLAGQGILGATAGAAAASGGGVSMAGAAAFAVSVGAASAAGGTVVMSAGSPATMVALAGAATAAGGTAAVTGGAVLVATAGAVTAGGGTASMSTGGAGTFTALTGAATASGGTAAMSGQARFVATAAAATASGGTALLAGAATFLALAATASASGGVATSTGAARMAVLAGQALAAGGVAQMVGDAVAPVPTPASRTLRIPYESRTLPVAREDRTLRVRST